MKTRNVAMMLSVALAASAARAVNYTWNSSSGGDLLDQTNYTPAGLPTASDTVTYNIDANYRLTASGDVPSHGPQTFSKGEIELDLGGHVWDAGSKYFYLNNPLLTLSSGMLTNLSQLVVSRTSPNARLVVTNGSMFKVSGQVVVGNDASSSHGGIVVADEGTTFSAVGGTVIGASGPFSALTVSDGARYSDANLTIGNVTTAVSNIVQVLNGSTVDTVSLEVKTHGNALIISNGSHVTASSAVNFAKAETCSSNRLEVWAGSTLHAGATKKPFAFGVGPDNVMLVDASSISVADTYFKLGDDATGSGNRLDVRNGSSFHVDSWIACAGSFNEMHFSDPGTEIVSESQLLIGQSGVGNVVSIGNQASASVFGVSVSNSAGSQSNVLEVADGACVDVNGKDLQIGVGGGASRLTIDGGSITNVSTVQMAAKKNIAGTDNNLLEIVNGGRLFANSIVYFGGVGNSNNVIRVAGAGSVLKNHDNYMSWASSSTNTVMYVEDAALVDIATTLAIGGAGGSGNAMIVSNATVKAGSAVSVYGVANLDIIGSGSSLTTSSDFTLTADATLRFVSDDEGFGKVVSGNRLKATEGAKLVIDGARVAKSGGGTFELLVGPELAKQYNTSNPLVNNVTLVPEDSELIVTRDAKQNIVNVSVRVPSKRSGIVVIVR